ncbi:MAG: hypothetical protein WAL20_10830 [Rhodomicrobium sp.]
MALKSSKRNTKNSETSAVREKAIAAPGVLFEEVAPCRRAARVSFRYLRLASWVESHADHMKDKSERREQLIVFRKVLLNERIAFRLDLFVQGSYPRDINLLRGVIEKER